MIRITFHPTTHTASVMKSGAQYFITEVEPNASYKDIAAKLNKLTRVD